MLKKLRTIIYHAPDLDAAKQWYTKVLGNPPYFDQPFYVGFNVEGSELGLDPDTNGVVHGNQSVAYWSVENIDDAVSNLLKQGAAELRPIQDVGGGTKVAVVTDPWGNAVGLIQESGE